MATNPLRRAAVLLTCLPPDDAAKLLSMLEPKQVEAVTIEVARLDAISADETDLAIQEFADANPNRLSIRGGGLALARTLVEKALGSNAAVTLDNVRQQIEAVPFGFLKTVDATNLLTFIVDEHPQTIALILSYLPAKQAAAVVTGLPANRQLQVVRRIATMAQTNPEIIREVEEGLSRRMSSLMSQQFSSAGGVKTVAQILNVTDRNVGRNLLDNLSQESAELVEDIRRLMFVFDDIIKFGDKEIQILLRNVEVTQWAMALKGTSETLKEKVLGNMSKRAADLLREEMSFLGSVRSANVQQAQQQIVDIVRRLEDQGEINLQAENESEQFIT